MHIVHIASEIAPLAKVGGLGDVVGGLSKAQAESGHKVEVILPAYSFLFNHPIYCDCTFETEKKEKISIFNMMYNHCILSLIHPHSRKNLFSRKKIYGYKDDVERFLYFAKAAFDYLLFRDETIDILHLHDWHTSIISLLVKEKSKDLNVKKSIQPESEKCFRRERSGLHADGDPDCVFDPLGGGHHRPGLLQYGFFDH